MGEGACDLSRAVQFPIITFYSFILDLGFTCLCCIFSFLFPALSSGGNEAQKNFTAWPTTYMFLTELELASIYKGYHFLIIQIHLVTTEFCFFLICLSQNFWDVFLRYILCVYKRKYKIQIAVMVSRHASCCFWVLSSCKLYNSSGSCYCHL